MTAHQLAKPSRRHASPLPQFASIARQPVGHGFAEVDRDQRLALERHYLQKFGAEHQKRTGAASESVATWLSKLDDTTVAMQFDYIANNVHPLGQKQKLESASAATLDDRRHSSVPPALLGLLEELGYYDVFLV